MPKMGQCVVGVDGMKAGWLAVTLLDGRFESAIGYGSLSELLASARMPERSASTCRRHFRPQVAVASQKIEAKHPRASPRSSVF